MTRLTWGHATICDSRRVVNQHALLSFHAVYSETESGIFIVADSTEPFENARLAKHVAQKIAGFVKAIDKCHENALNLGYNLRRELNVLSNDKVKSLDEIMN